MDTFYTRVMAIRDRRGQEGAHHLLAELELLEREAFEWLIAEKLAADESFRIFTDLAGRLRDDLTEDLKAGAGQAPPASAE